MKRSIIIGALLLILGFVIGLLCRSKSIERVVDIQRDTAFVVDTHIIEKPVLVEKHTKDTLFVAVRDTIRQNDTLYLSLPRETKIYAEKEYYAEVSGYEPSLDYLEFFPITTVVTEKVADARPKNSIGLGIEPSYLNTFSIPIYLEYTRMLHKNLEIYGQVGYDLPTRMWGVGVGMHLQIEW